MQKKCPACGRNFVAGNANQKYCDGNCKQKMWKMRHGGGKKMKSPPGVSPEKIVGLSEHDIRIRHDNMFKIREGCKKLVKARYLPDQQMREFCQIAPGVWRSYSDHPDFENYRMKLTGMVYWGHLASIRKMKEDLNAT